MEFVPSTAKPMGMSWEYHDRCRQSLEADFLQGFFVHAVAVGQEAAQAILQVRASCRTTPPRRWRRARVLPLALRPLLGRMLTVAPAPPASVSSDPSSHGSGRQGPDRNGR